MLSIINRKLREIEEAEQVKIILAVESGSRAWGFASSDSDYDVRFLYVRQPEEYLKLKPVRDVIEWQLDDVLDINGWDAAKALRLLYQSNPTVFEWSNSPIVYRKTPEFESFRGVLSEYFSVKKGLYHYWHMADNNYKTYLTGEEVILKKYFYALRPVLAAKWILDKKSPPPVLFDDLLRAELPCGLKTEIDFLLEKKKQASETRKEKKVPEIDRYLKESIEAIRQAAGETSEEQEKSWEPLDRCFLEILRSVW